ncbi:MAG: pirin family protein [Bdellovibrionales bacterium]|nr:pirin family protein [Bdellovibrionales bacterium]
MSEKGLQTVLSTLQPHWVGDGFPVRTIFDYNEQGEALSPFLLMDYAAPTEFPPAERPRGVGEHPHRGIETVTIVYEGEVSHRDSTGAKGTLSTGDVQWMTAAGGIVHEEFHSEAFTKRGGRMEMVQLWVNLPAKEKMSPPRYQELTTAIIPTVKLPDGAGSARIIAGGLFDAKGPARTVTPIDLWDLKLKGGKTVALPVPSTHTTAVLVLRGELRFGSRRAGPGELALYTREGDAVPLAAGAEDVTALLLGGEPIREPIVGMGPFVMNTQGEIRQAFRDYQSGKMGHLN